MSPIIPPVSRSQMLYPLQTLDSLFPANLLLLLPSPSCIREKHCFFFFLIFIFSPCRVACGILVPQPGIEPVPPAVKAWSLNHWTTREVLLFNYLHLTEFYVALVWASNFGFRFKEPIQLVTPRHCSEIMCGQSFNFPEPNANKRSVLLHFICPVILDSKALLVFVHASTMLD